VPPRSETGDRGVEEAASDADRSLGGRTPAGGGASFPCRGSETLLVRRAEVLDGGTEGVVVQREGVIEEGEVDEGEGRGDGSEDER